MTRRSTQSASLGYLPLPGKARRSGTRKPAILSRTMPFGGLRAPAPTARLQKSGALNKSSRAQMIWNSPAARAVSASVTLSNIAAPLETGRARVRFSKNTVDGPFAERAASSTPFSIPKARKRGQCLVGAAS
jgi:hypothetical protein